MHLAYGGSGRYTLAITSDAMSKHKSRFAAPALRVAQTTKFESNHAIRSLTYLALSPPLFAVRFIAQTTAFTCGMLEQQIVYTQQLSKILVQSPRKVTPLKPNLPFAGTADDVAEAAQRQTIAQAAKPLASLSRAARNVIDEDAQAIVKAADGAEPALITTPDDDQEIHVQAEWIANNKQLLKNGEAGGSEAIVTEMKPMGPSMSHGPLAIERHALASDVDFDSKPNADGTLRTPHAQERMNVAKVGVEEIVGISKRLIDDVENVRDIVRHEELRVDDATTTIRATYQGVNHKKLVTLVNAAVPALVPMSGSTTTNVEQGQASLNGRVRERAYALWEAEGRPEGRSLDYWTQAEREIYATPTSATAI